MKNFWRSAIGKTTLFVAFTLSLLLLIISVVGVIGMFSADVYTTDEAETIRNIRRDEALSYVMNCMYSRAETGDSYNGGNWAEMEVVSEDGETYATEGAAEAAQRAENGDGYDKFVFSIVMCRRRIEGGRYDVDFGYYEEGYRYSFYQSAIVPEDEGNNEYTGFTVTAYCKTDESRFPSDDLLFMSIHILYVMKYAVYAIIFITLLLCVYIFVSLMMLAGHRPDSEEIQPGLFIKLPFDIVVCAVAFFAVFALWTIDEAFFSYDLLQWIALSVYLVVFLNILLGLCMSFAVRLKLRRFLKCLFVYQVIALVLRCIRAVWRGVCRACAAIGRFFSMIPIVWKTAAVAFALTFGEFMIIMMTDGELDNLLLWWLAEKAILIPVLIYAAYSFKKLESAGRIIAHGDLSYRTNTKGLFRTFRRHAEDLNSISGTIAAAVEENMKSERMKTELITNVSHDLKTPLTSMINYAKLIGNEECDNENITQYSEVLVRQSEKLKRLIEDLVEVSKASTGNLDINSEPCDASTFISQASGEYEDKIRAAGLELVTSQPDHEVNIMADTRRMWRVFDNLMGNACKYSQSGTRVYLALTEIGNYAFITLKNTSREPLNISSDELMARFVRGDSSRNTEGNGLGLSIAKSLVELQGGIFALNIDGDLFKITLRFDKISPIEETEPDRI